jgi:hypothetical protein
MVSFDHPQNLIFGQPPSSPLTSRDHPERTVSPDLAGWAASAFSSDAIEDADRLFGKVFLILELFQIPEFLRLWAKAFEKQYIAVESIIACHRTALDQISPEGREAFTGRAVVQIQAAEGRKAFIITESGAEAARRYGAKAVLEACVVTNVLNEATKQLGQIIGDQIDDMGSVSYRVALENLVGPLGVPGLPIIIMTLEGVARGWHERLASVCAIDGSLREGWLRDQLEAHVLKGLTDLSPAQLAKEPPRRIRRRMAQKIAPLKRHYFRGDGPFRSLRQRIHLWVRNKVLGETISEIAQDLQSDESRSVAGVSPQSWVEQQIGEATRILGAKVSSGRPRKGGMLRQWKRVP